MRTVLLRPICEDDVNTLFALTGRNGLGALLKRDPLNLRNACAEHRGTVAIMDSEVVAACLFETRTISIPPGTRKGYVAKATVMFNLVVDAPYQNLGVGLHVGEAAVGQAYATSDGRFPQVVGVSFTDSEQVLRLQKQAGMPQVLQNSCEVECEPFLRAIDSMAWRNKDLVEEIRPHSVQYLPLASLPSIGRWLTVAFSGGGYQDVGHQLLYRFIDPSPWSSISAVLAELALSKPRALERLGFTDVVEEPSSERVVYALLSA